MLPIIFVAPHACSTIEGDLRSRYALTDYEIWRCSDPYTDQLSEFTCASIHHVAKVNRLVCDLNRAPHIDKAFRETDFFGNDAFFNETIKCFPINTS